MPLQRVVLSQAAEGAGPSPQLKLPLSKSPAPSAPPQLTDRQGSVAGDVSKAAAVPK
jgi:hypothetical protein